MGEENWGLGGILGKKLTVSGLNIHIIDPFFYDFWPFNAKIRVVIKMGSIGERNWGGVKIRHPCPRVDIWRHKK